MKLFSSVLFALLAMSSLVHANELSVYDVNNQLLGSVFSEAENQQAYVGGPKFGSSQLLRQVNGSWVQISFASTGLLNNTSTPTLYFTGSNCTGTVYMLASFPALAFYDGTYLYYPGVPWTNATIVSTGTSMSGSGIGAPYSCGGNLTFSFTASAGAPTATDLTPYGWTTPFSLY